MENRLYGVFGGTFDPVHNGHIQTVTTVYENCDLERISFIPAAVPPHRSQPTANAQQRLEMVTLAIANHPQFDADDRELKRNAPSYTFDTVKSLQAEDPEKHYCLILGLDAFLALETWYCWQELLESIHFIVMRRPGWRLPDSLPEWWDKRFTFSLEDLKRNNFGKICLIDVMPNPVSATEIRYGLSNGIDVSSMLPEPVWDYINSNNLYRS